MGIAFRHRTVLICATILLAQIAPNNISAKNRSSQHLLRKVDELERYSRSLEDKVKLLEDEIKAIKAAQLDPNHSIGTDKAEAGLGVTRSGSGIDEVEQMSQGLAKQDRSIQVSQAQDQGDVVTEAGLYNQITRMIERRDYSKAQIFAQSYMQSYSQEKNAPAVLFWLGEIKMLFGELIDAKSYYMKSLDMLKGKGRTPEILLKIAVISYQKGDTAEGDHYYDQLQKIYPGSTASHMARAQRKKYRSEYSD